jgi:hypothetical protein
VPVITTHNPAPPHLSQHARIQLLLTHKHGTQGITIVLMWAQVMLSSVAVPGVQKLQRAATHYQQQHPGCSYYADLLKAHAAVGLTRQVTLAAGTGPAAADSSSSSSSSHRGRGLLQQQQHQHLQQQQQQQPVAWGFASVAPVKDMEITVVGRHMCCPAFQRMLHAALRGLIDGLGVAAFNVGVLNVDVTVQAPSTGVGLGRGWWPSQETHFSSSNSSNGSSGSGVGGALQLHPASSSGGHYVHGSSSDCSSDGSNGGFWLPDASYWADRPPVIARLASRGKLSNAASDFGGLEVWGGASIGHTDPFTVVQQLDAQLAAGVMHYEGLGRVVAN